MLKGMATRDARWTPAVYDVQHALRLLIDSPVRGYVLRLFEGPRGRFGSPYFRLHLENTAKELSNEPILIGLYAQARHAGQKWIEIAGASAIASFEGARTISIDPMTTEVGRRVWQLLGDSISPGGHLMVEYESPEWRETARGLTLGIPPVSTPLGYLLFRVGCGVNFKDWYFSEGLHEGPRKLQGWKALDDEHRHRRAAEMIKELRRYLASAPVADDLHKRARRRAQSVLNSLMHHPEELPRLARAGEL